MSAFRILGSQMKKKGLFFLGMLGLNAFVSVQKGLACTGLFSGDLELDVLACSTIDPVAKVKEWKKDNEWLDNFSSTNLEEFKLSYKGEIIKGRVNSAKPIGQNKNFVGRNLVMFSKINKIRCAENIGKRILVIITQVCCNGSGNSPCLLDTPYVVSAIKPAGPSFNTPKEILNNYVVKNPKIKNALSLLDQKKYEESTTILKAESQHLYAKYLLAFAYRNMSSPEASLAPLEDWRKAYLSNTLSHDELVLAKDALLMLAKCYALTRQPEKSIAILNIFLAKPRQFSRELKLADSSEDFGWIKATQEWRDYQKRRAKIK